MSSSSIRPPPQQAPLTLDTNTAELITKTNKKISDYVHQIANEPSVGLFHVQEHIRKAVPKNVTLKKDMKSLSTHIEEVSYEVNDSTSTVQIFAEINTFDHIHKMLLSSIDKVSKLVNNKQLQFVNSSHLKPTASTTFSSFHKTFEPSTVPTSSSSLSSSSSNTQTNASVLSSSQVTGTSDLGASQDNNNNNNIVVNNSGNDIPIESNTSAAVTSMNMNESQDGTTSEQQMSTSADSFNEIPVSSTPPSSSSSIDYLSTSSSKKKTTGKKKSTTSNGTPKKKKEEVILQPKQF
ncbi:hypothetical protein SAMD00019534_071610, partial [Acytostelium subglobosum LB1]|uniref:hypothetical protein n=1 Tax=Acytostelium subglobosum LB1 TaxID=1410327 RepID=UPI0006447C12